MATTKSAPGSNMTSTRCRVLDLPAELRIFTYELIFGSLANLHNPVTKEEAIHCLALLHTSHEVHNDAMKTFKSHQTALGNRFAFQCLAARGAAEERSERVCSLEKEFEIRPLFPWNDTVKKRIENQEEVKEVSREQERFEHEAEFYGRVAEGEKWAKYDEMKQAGLQSQRADGCNVRELDGDVCKGSLGMLSRGMPSDVHSYQNYYHGGGALLSI